MIDSRTICVISEISSSFVDDYADGNIATDHNNEWKQPSEWEHKHKVKKLLKD